MKITENMVLFFRAGDVLSNWHHSPFENEIGLKFSNNEQYFMFQKAILFRDKEKAEEILKEEDPKAVKRLGREVQGFNHEVWSSHSTFIMSKGLFLKAKHYKPFRDILLEYGPTHDFVEASPYDKIWGCGLGENDKNILIPSKWPGKNKLGICLDVLAEALLVHGW